MLTLRRAHRAGGRPLQRRMRAVMGHDQHRAGEPPRVQVDVVIASAEPKTLRTGSMFPWREVGEHALEGLSARQEMLACAPHQTHRLSSTAAWVDAATKH